MQTSDISAPHAAEPPTVVVHGADTLRLAIRTAQRVGLPSLQFLSAPFAAASMGPAWWRALATFGETLAGSLAVRDVLDCGDEPGRALEALRLGQRRLVLCPGPQWKAVRERTDHLGATLLRSRPASFDLGAPGAEYHLPNWLRGSLPGG